MTNPDTSTLNGALEQLGITMADNLVTMGVSDADPSDGLTTLAGKILEIAPVPPTPTPASIDLTGTKSILSYADSESATLSATVLDSNDDPMEGVTVTFYNGSTSMGTADTNSSGIATKSYASRGSGDVSFTASVGTIVSKIYELQDKWYYNDGTKLTGLTIGSGVSCVVENDYLKISKSYSGEDYVILPLQFTTSDNFIIEWEVACLGTNQRTAFWLNTAASSTGLWCCYEGGHFTGNSIGGSIPTTTTSLDVGDKIYLKQENGVISILKNDETIFSKSMSFSSSTYKFGYYTNSGRVQCVDNIKITRL